MHSAFLQVSWGFYVWYIEQNNVTRDALSTLISILKIACQIHKLYLHFLLHYLHKSEYNICQLNYFYRKEYLNIFDLISCFIFFKTLTDRMRIIFIEWFSVDLELLNDSSLPNLCKRNDKIWIFISVLLYFSCSIGIIERWSKVPASHPTYRGFELYHCHDSDSSYDTSIGWFY